MVSFTTPPLPAMSTVHAVLDRHHLVKRRRRRRDVPAGTMLSRPTEPNALWCADYKGEFMLGDRRYCYPLTITDFASRYLLTCEALSTTQERSLQGVRLRDQGLWAAGAIRTDNGMPFASPPGCIGSASWRCGGSGSGSDRADPTGASEENGRHERMHRTLKRKRPNPLRRTCCSSRKASMPL